MNTSFESNKIPVGVVDGINKIFTFEKEIYQMSTLWVGGAPYFDYIISGKTIILQDSPQASYVVPIIGSYFTSGNLFGTSEGITILEAKTLLEEDGEVDTSNIPNLARWINEFNQTIYRFDCLKNIGKYVQSADITTIKGQSEYIKPSNFLNINAEKLGLFKVAGDNHYPVRETEFGSLVEGYYFEGGKIVITPTPSSQINNYVLRYLPVLDKITLDTDKIIIGQEYTELVTNYLLKKYWRWAEDNGKASIYDFDFKRTLNEFLSNYGQRKNYKRIRNNNDIYTS